MVSLDKLQILQIAKEICVKHRCTIVEIDFDTHVINIERPADEPELRQECMNEIEEMLALYLS
ncbi:hypothetical protein D3OALGA1CA_3569 [Olavius algarvensis associated proteobacterium Delta 3]|nr:hypothetical protein D3OALGA1CA_3569 [Olavius algarvensis associated proteobacterium Delta 3]